MTEIQHYEPVALESESDLIRWARDAREAHTIATSLVKTSFVPDSMRNKPHEAAAAILTGQEIGLTPMAALRSIDIIQGTPAMRAHALRGLVQARGHEVWVEEAGPAQAIVCGRRKGEQHEQRSVWTIDRARQLKLTDKSNWKNQPQAMLVARATSELCRLIASDVLLGVPYSIEELTDDAPEPTATVARKVKRQVAPEVEAPALDAIEDKAVEVEPSPEVAAPDLDWPEVAQVPGE